jgi:hypothetical protein
MNTQAVKKRRTTRNKDKTLPGYREYFDTCGIRILEGLMESHAKIPEDIQLLLLPRRKSRPA